MKDDAVAFVWENFGPLHVDRCEATATRLAGRRRVFGLELGGKSSTYDWENPSAERFAKRTLFPGVPIESIGLFERIKNTLTACLDTGARDIFLCHYEHVATFIVAILLRIMRRRVYVMNDSKFDDYERNLLRELGKAIFYLPYCGGLASGVRSKDYLRFLGVNPKKIMGVYNALDIARMRRSAGDWNSAEFRDRYFSIIARFVPKKNLDVALLAYAKYAGTQSRPRRLVVCGSGPLEQHLRDRVAALGLESNVSFRGFVSAEDVAKVLAQTLALLLPSIEEQFGNVVLEAQALKVPVILSTNCGARDEVIRTGVNGFIVEPDNPEGLAFYMELLANDEHLWKRMRGASDRFEALYSADRFADAVKSLIES